MKPEDLRSTLREGKPVFGTMVAMCRTPDVMLLLAHAGMDFTLIDTEHGAFTTETVADLCRVARGVDLSAILRVPGRGPTYVSRSLDIGAKYHAAQDLLGPWPFLDAENRNAEEVVVDVGVMVSF